MKLWLAYRLMALAMKWGAVQPPRLIISLTVDGMPLLLMTDEQAQWQAAFEGGSFKMSAGPGKVVLTLSEFRGIQ